MLTVLDGNSFLVADDHGNVGSGSEGLYFDDTRYLSRWQLLLNGEPPQLLSSDTVDHYSASVFLQNPQTSSLPAGAVSLIRTMYVGEGSLQTTLHVENHVLDTVELNLQLEFDFDFLDLFEVKAREYREEDLVFTHRTDPGVDVRVEHDDREHSWSFRLDKGAFRAEALVWVSQRGTVGERSVSHSFTLAPGHTWESRANIVLLSGDSRRRERYTSFYFGQERDRVAASMRGWRTHTPELVTDWEELRGAYHQSLADLSALRMRQRQTANGIGDLPAAGLPWFMTVFGRDTLLTSYQTLLLGPTLAAGTLETLAALQARERDDTRDSEPGKIVHELRVGRVAAEGGSFPYYGSVDATLLFLILLSEAYRWTGDVDTVSRLREPAMAALRWMRELGDLDGDGFVEYHRRAPGGLESQTWKDSWDSMRFRDGTVATTPVAAAEVQGYAYDARCRTAELARRVWDDAPLAAQLEREAAELKARFNERLLLRARRRLLRARPRPREAADRLAQLQHRPPAVVGDRRRAARRGHRRAADVGLAQLRLGRPHHVRSRPRLQPDRIPHGHGLAARQQPDHGAAWCGTATASTPTASPASMLDGRAPLRLPAAGGVRRLPGAR